MTAAWLIWLAIVLLTFVALEGYAWLRGGESWTLSACIRRWAAKWHFVAAAVCGTMVLLMVHFFWVPG